MTTPAHLEALAERVKRLPTSDKLALASELLRADRADLAETVTSLAFDELRAARLLGTNVLGATK